MKTGIDLGGSKIELIVLDEVGSEHLRKRVPTPQGDYRATLAALLQLIESAETELRCRTSIGIGTPGSLSRISGRMKNSNSTCLNDQALLEDLQSVLRRPVRIANDADCFALSEATDGAAAGLANVFGVILGTGVGGGIVVHGKLLSGPNGIAGEWGHNPLPWPTDVERPGPACYCGKHGCIETFVSGPGLARDHRERTGVRLDAREIVFRAEAGDDRCAVSLRIFEERLSRSLAHVINLLDPDAIVLGGGLSNCDSLYRNLPALLETHVFSDRVDTRLLRPRFGDSSGVRGAAWLWDQ